MTDRVRMFIATAAAILIGVFVVMACVELPGFGGTLHPYRTAAIAAAVQQQTANVVSSVNFDLRGLDTLIEESILLCSVLGVSVLLRPAADEEERRIPSGGRILASSRLAGYLALPVTVVIGIQIVAHGHLTPGGGFQGGIVIGTAIHLLYVAGSFGAVDRIRPLSTYHVAEAIGAGGFAVVGVTGAIGAGAFLANSLPHGSFGQLLSSGTVPLLNGLVGLEVVASTVVLLAAFLDQEIIVRKQGDDR